jgi:adenine phosphoribosyltransferase
MKPEMSVAELRALIRDVADFPKPGILFKDITPLLSDSRAFHSLAEHMAALVPEGTTKLAAIESRGFILGSAMAMKLGIGMVLIRKPGKLPYATLSHSYALEYGSDTLQIHVDALNETDRVCIVDDVLATGGTAQATEILCIETGAKVSGFALLMELGFLNGRAKLKSPVAALMTI